MKTFPDLAQKRRWLGQPLAVHGVRNVLRLGYYNYSRAQPGLSEHTHPGTIEICYLVKGRQTYVMGGTSYRLRGGDVFIALPQEQHSTGGLPEEKGALYWIQYTLPGAGETFLGLPREQGQAVLEGLFHLRQRHFRGTWRMKECLDEMMRLYHEPPSPLVTAALSNRATAFLLSVIEASQSAEPESKARLQPTLQHIESHLEGAIKLSELAQLLGVSVSRFKIRFKEEMGVPPAEYIQRRRIEEARRRIQQSTAPITQIAFDLGFSSSQYFATVFKRYTGSAPRELRQRK
ncbi:MAG TPA: helix-turn-helix domain-containing protein [Chthoniobacterales bacterium]|jgi:AraC-like DNA-binding protein/mannose-6-phosphate isomerase-like protein (cupin superfamily)